MTHHHHGGPHQPGDHTSHHDHGEADPAFAELLDLDGEVLRSYWNEVLTWIRRTVAGARCERIVDLGAGTGVGTIEFAQRFATAKVVAVDRAEDLLQRIRDKALDLGLAERIRTVRADLDLGWPVAGPIDLTWASLSLHHLADPDRVLRDVHAATRPGGLLAIVEIGEQLHYLPHDLGLGRPGLEDRLHGALSAELAQSLPELGSQWEPRIEAAGFSLLARRQVGIDVRPGSSHEAGRYAHLWFARLRSGLADQLSADDLSTLDALLAAGGPQSVQRRDDLHLRGSRTVILAQRT